MLSLFSLNAIKGKSIGHLSRLCKISKNHNVKQIAFMRRLAFKQQISKPAPFPYWRRECNSFTMMADLTTLRYDENTKLIIVDGPPAVGKTKVCEELAKEFGLLYMPPPTHDEIYINQYGFDLRQLDPQLPNSCKSCDLAKFLANPHDVQVPFFQLMYLIMRLEQYMNALVHILASGQGVVLNRSIYTDIAFSEAMRNAGYLSNQVIKEFDAMRTNTYGHLLKPHVVIYLEASPEITLENIKKRGNEHEIKSKVLTKNYLSDLENITKEKCLSWLAPHSHVMVYDWNTPGHIMDIVSDIENTDLEEKEESLKLQDWVFLTTDQLIDNLSIYQEKALIYSYMHDLPVDSIAAELYCSGTDAEAVDNILDEVETEKYAFGFHPKFDKVPIFAGRKLSLCKFRRTPRDFVNCELFESP